MGRPPEQIIVLVRHGEASPVKLEGGRPLTPRGHCQAEATAAWLAGLRLPLAEIRHSGKLRAQETAEVLARQLRLRALAVRGLAPRDPAEAVRDELEGEAVNVVLVGHSPHLGGLAALLLGAGAAAVRFDEATAAVLQRDASGWGLLDSFTPGRTPR